MSTRDKVVGCLASTCGGPAANILISPIGVPVGVTPYPVGVGVASYVATGVGGIDDAPEMNFIGSFRICAYGVGVTTWIWPNARAGLSGIDIIELCEQNLSGSGLILRRRTSVGASSDAACARDAFNEKATCAGAEAMGDGKLVPIGDAMAFGEAGKSMNVFFTICGWPCCTCVPTIYGVPCMPNAASRKPPWRWPRISSARRRGA